MTSTAGESLTPGHEVSTPRPGVWLTDLGLLGMATIWGVNYSVVKYGATLLGPLAYNGFRLTIASIALLVVARAMREPMPSRRVALALLGLGVIGNGAYQYFFIEGIARTRAADAALIASASPVMMALIGQARGTEHVPAKRFAGIALSIAGIALVVTGSQHDAAGTSSIAGDLLVLTGSLCWAVYAVLLKPFTHDVSGIRLSALTMVGGTIPLVAVAAPSLIHAPWTSVPATVWFAALYSSLGALVIAYLLWYRGLRVLGPTRAAIYGNLQPVIALLVAWALLSEVPTVWQVGGTACIMSGLLVTRA